MDRAADTPVTELRATRDRLRAAWQAHQPMLDNGCTISPACAPNSRRAPRPWIAIRADFGHRLHARDPGLRCDDRSRDRSPASPSARLDATQRATSAGSYGRRARRCDARRSAWSRDVAVELSGQSRPGTADDGDRAGNHVYLKPSEHTPRTSAWLRELLAAVFPQDRVAVAFGDAALGAAFAALPFDHLVFTGSTAVGRKVMAAAAPNLTPLTLELGGKSPAIVAADFPVEQAAARLATGKWFNGGQTCIAPDYVLVAAEPAMPWSNTARADSSRDGASFDKAGEERRRLNPESTTRSTSTARVPDDAARTRTRGIELVQSIVTAPMRNADRATCCSKRRRCRGEGGDFGPSYRPQLPHAREGDRHIEAHESPIVE